MTSLFFASEGLITDIHFVLFSYCFGNRESNFLFCFAFDFRYRYTFRYFTTACKIDMPFYQLGGQVDRAFVLDGIL